MKYLAIALAALMLTACGTTQPQGPRGAIIASLDAELAQQCINRVRREDVPAIPEGSTRPRDRDTARYIRTLEDAYEICERIVREGVEAGNVQ